MSTAQGDFASPTTMINLEVLVHGIMGRKKKLHMILMQADVYKDWVLLKFLSIAAQAIGNIVKHSCRGG